MRSKLFKTICLFLSLAIIAVGVPTFSIASSATTKGSASCSASAQDTAAKASMSLYNASSTSGTTATYIVDKYYYPTMADYGNIYSVTFEGTGMYANTCISASGDFSISNTGTRTDHPINIQQNSYAVETHSGTLVGSVPAPGQQKTVSLNGYVRINYNIPGYLNGLAVFESSTSVTMNAVVIGVDSTELQELLLKYSDYKESCWTAASWAAFSTAYSNAKSVAESKTALQSEINSALSSLQTAVAGLEHDGDITECAYCLSGSKGNSSKSVESFYDLSYGNSNMDLFIPAKAEGDVALILFIHGGAWIGGDKSEFTAKALDACSKYGVVSATVNYRFADCFNVTGWSILDDIQSAVTMIKSMAADRGLNVVKMMTAGHSAGGHLSLMYAYTRQDTSPVRPVCVWDMAGPTTLYNSEYLKEDGLVLALSAVCGQYFTADQAAYAFLALESMSPTKYIGSALPTLICHGVQDSIVPYSDGAALDAALTTSGVAHTFITFPNSNHGLESDPGCYDQMMSEYDRYVRTYILPGGVPNVVHNYETETVEATCTQKGYTIYSCVDCGKYYVSDVTGYGHTPAQAVVENQTQPTCSQFGGYDEVAYCTECGAEVSRNHVQIAKLAHTPGETVIENQTSATCTANGGYDEVVYCTVCEAEISRNHVQINMLSHIPGETVIENETAPTCTVDGGYDEVVYCTRCGDEISRNHVSITMLSHIPGEAVRENETSPTCSVTGGYDDVVCCTRCGSELSRTHTSLGKTSHQVGPWEVTLPATYTTPGTQVKRCIHCGTIINSKSIPVLEPEFAPAAESDLNFDSENMLIKNIPQGVSDLSEYFFLGGCTVEFEGDVVATGTTVTVRSFAGTTLATYTAVVSGDVTGDGYIDAFDLALAGEHVNTFTEPEDIAVMKACDMFDDGYLDATDIAYLIYIANFE
ncbi:MAG: alpha/beta hydrolase fold domain-containing protein [Clostridia bacterium]|nr:alpha/beta hydrolase fold domain-containing protein [Clostridia bacterium]